MLAHAFYSTKGQSAWRTAECVSRQPMTCHFLCVLTSGSCASLCWRERTNCSSLDDARTR